MLISKELAAAFNAQIGHEYGAGLQYVSIAAYFRQRQQLSVQTQWRCARKLRKLERQQHGCLRLCLSEPNQLVSV